MIHFVIHLINWLSKIYKLYHLVFKWRQSITLSLLIGLVSFAILFYGNKSKDKDKESKAKNSALDLLSSNDNEEIELSEDYELNEDPGSLTSSSGYDSDIDMNPKMYYKPLVDPLLDYERRAYGKRKH